MARRGWATSPVSHSSWLHPGCHWGCNQWLIERWRETATELLRRARRLDRGHRVEPGAANGPGDRRRGVGPLLQFAAGETTLGQLAALISLSSLVVAVDTAPTQICQALKTARCDDDGRRHDELEWPDRG